CVRIGCQTGFSNPSTISSTTAATLGTHSLTNPGRLCPSRDATGQQSVTQSEDWYKSRPVAARAGQGLLGPKAPPEAGLEVSPSRGTSARVGRVTQDVHFRRSRHYVLRYQYKPPGYSRRRGSVAIRALPDLRFGIVSRRLGHLGP